MNGDEMVSYLREVADNLEQEFPEVSALIHILISSILDETFYDIHRLMFQYAHQRLTELNKMEAAGLLGKQP